MKSEYSGIAIEIKRSLSSSLANLQGPAALAFSGGLDSSVLMAASEFSLNCYTAGIKGSRDLDNSREATHFMGFTAEEITLSENQVIEYARMVKSLDPMIEDRELGYEVVLTSVLDHIREVTLVTGQGADEIFYGYHRFLDDPDLTNEAHMRKLFSRTLKREKRIAGYFGKILITPYLDEGVITAVSGLKRSDHISGNKNKIVLREVAESYSIPVEIRERAKKAAQYGSGVNKIILRAVKEGAIG